MLHTCSLTRCQRGDPSLACKYGFPSQVAVSSTLPRQVQSAYLAVLTTGGLSTIHRRSPSNGDDTVNLLRTRESPECSPNGLHYIVKYNFKVDPSLLVEGGAPGRDSYETFFHAQVTSSDEAVAMICSHDCHGSDVTCTYISLKPPDRLYTAVIHSEQVQISAVEKHYARPLELSQLRIQDFFSLFDVIDLCEANNQINCKYQEEGIDPIPAPPRTVMPMLSLQDHAWEMDNLPELSLITRGPIIPSQTLPNPRALECWFIRQPAVVLTDGFNFAYRTLDHPHLR